MPNKTKDYQVLHKRSNQVDNETGYPKLPDAEILEYGELAVNYREGMETISLKNDGGKVVAIASVISQDIITDKLAKHESYYNFMNGVNRVTSVSNIPVNKHFVVATISANGTLSFNGTLAENRELHIFVKNNGSADIEVTLSGTTPKGVTTLGIAAGAYGEINVINIGGRTYYTRAAN